MKLKKIFHRRGKVGMKRRRSKVGSFFMFLGIFLLAAIMASTARDEARLAKTTR